MNYRLLTEDLIREAHGTVSVYEHQGTGARVMTVRNHDPNKVFMIAFRTTPRDSAGTAHIMEHSVLCGSRKYPIRDPFVELAKGSLNTFLNAMTYPDKTVYPIASVNDKDFMNLMDVYLDSVFYPRALSDERIFRQEGWHLERDDTGELSINGVVYNEMKGAFSSPDQVLERRILKSLFPHTTYAYESGGDPEDIPDLSFSDFKAFHGTFYHPSNSYIYLYGDMDMEEKLNWLDREYLSSFERKDPPGGAEAEAPFKAPIEEKVYYALAPHESIEKKALLSENFCIPGEPSRLSALSYAVLDYILLSSPGAVLKEALIKAGIGCEIEGGYTGELRQPYFSVIARNADEGQSGDFKRVIRDTLRGLTDSGIPKRSLKGALNYIEFKCREEDYGAFPAGLYMGLNALSTWLYDMDPKEFIRYEDAVMRLKELIDTDYFEKLIRETFLDNAHSSLVIALPDRELEKEREERLRKRLSIYKESLNKEELDAISGEAAELKAWQGMTESEEALKCLPVLNISDIEKKAKRLNASLHGDIIYTEADAGGIAYVRAAFDTEGLSEEEIMLIAFLSDILSEVDTENYSYKDLSDLTMLNTGGISFKASPYAVSGGNYRGLFEVSLRVLDNKVADGMGLIKEIINKSVLDDPLRMAELIAEVRSSLRSSIEGAMHKAAVTRASSYISPMERYLDITSGIAYYDFLGGVERLSAEPVHMRRFLRSLKQVAVKLFSGKPVLALYGSRDALAALRKEEDGFRESLNEGALKRKEDLSRELKKSGAAASAFTPGREVSNLSCLNEGFKTGSEVNYDAVAGNYLDKGLSYHGSLNVLRVMLSYDYLWTRIRVMGGAYGCMAAFTRSGMMYMTSYRDPGIADTYRVYEELKDFLSSYEAGEDMIRKFIIGAIAAKDHPLTHSMRALDEFSSYIYGLSDSEVQRERDEILSCTISDLRNCSLYIEALLSSGARCTIGNARAIDECSGLFTSVRGLF